MRRTAIWSGLLLLASPPAWAIEGAIQIGHERALAGGVTPGDSAGYPVTIDTPGKYILTSALAQAGTSTDFISITASGVSLDLNGFYIGGPAACTGTPVTSCSDTGSGDAIRCTSNADRIRIRNGLISGAPGVGIICEGEDVEVLGVTILVSGGNALQLGANCRVRDVIAISNGGRGVEAGARCVIERSIFADNGDDGIRVGDGTRIELNIAGQNDGMGIVGAAGVIRSNSVSNNTGTGIENSGGVGASIRGNAVGGNSGFGIETNPGAVIVQNAVVANGTLITDEGISAGPGSTVIANAVRANTGPGLALGAMSGSGYGHNALSGNAGGQLTGSGVAIGCNAAEGVVTCP